MPRNRAKGGLFKEAATPDLIPAKFSITDGQSWLNALGAASARHRVSRTQTGDDLATTEEGGSLLSVTPAGSEDELRDQIGLLTVTFERAEGRPPSDRDDEFWIAVNHLFDAYKGPKLGSVADVMGGLS